MKTLILLIITLLLSSCAGLHDCEFEPSANLEKDPDKPVLQQIYPQTAVKCKY